MEQVTEPRLGQSADVFYQIYPQSFADGNHDGIGDLRGIIQKLDYLQDLGITGVWINPIYLSPFRDAGYDIQDHCSIAPRYGELEDLTTLCAQAHKRGIKVFLDLVPGHTSDQHPNFRTSSSTTPGEYQDRYIWTSSAFDAPFDCNLPFISGQAPRNGCYIVNFFSCQPALNFGFHTITHSWQDTPRAAGPQANIQEIARIMRYWLAQGIDGFRVDMADSLVKNDPDKEATIAVWQEIFALVRPIFPEAIFISEWGRPAQAFAAGFDLDFYLDWRFADFHNGYNQLARDTDTPASRTADNSFFNADSATTAAGFLADYLPLYHATKNAGIFSLISCNHDSPRLAPRLTTAERSLFFIFLLTMPGIPFLYYGDEIGMRYLPHESIEGGYARTGSRAMMPWPETPVPHSTLMPVDATFEPEVELQSLIRNLIQLRKSMPALQQYDNLRCEEPSGKQLCFHRGELTILLNVSHETVTLPTPLQQSPLFHFGTHTTTHLGPLSAIIFEDTTAA